MPMEEKIRALLAHSSLTDTEAREFLSLLLYHDKEGLDEICALFEEDATWIEWLYDNYRAKKDAFASGDDKRLEEILQEETKMFE